MTRQTADKEMSTTSGGSMSTGKKAGQENPNYGGRCESKAAMKRTNTWSATGPEQMNTTRCVVWNTPHVVAN